MNLDHRLAKLVYFERWTSDETAERIFSTEPALDVQRLSYGDARAHNDAVFSTAHGYQIHAQVELDPDWAGNAALLARAPNLLAISSTGSGYDVIDVAACTAAGVLVCNQAGANALAVAEHAVGLMLATSKRIVRADRILHQTGDVDRFAYTGSDISGKTVGILGIGHIGRETARICANGFAMKVIAHDPYLSAEEIRARGAEPVDREILFSQSDFLSIHCPRSEETLGSIAADEFSRMKRSAFFINTARGGIHDEEALAEALENEQIAGAGLDVFVEEPPQPHHRLLAFDTVIASPHIAGVTVESQQRLTEYAATQWVELLSGRRPPRVVNPEAWPLFAERFRQIRGFDPEPL